MKIAPTDPSPPPQAAANDTAAHSQRSDQSSSGPATQTRVSQRARAMADEGAIDEAKVGRLREMIANETFVIDRQQIANAIVDG